MRPFQVWLGPLLFIKTPLETAQLLSKLFPFGLFLSIRSSQRRRSVKKGAVRNFAKFTGKQLCQSLFFNKVAGLEFAKFLKACFYRTPPDGCFCCIFSFFIKARILLQFLSPVFSILFSPFFFVFINALLIST